MAVSERLADGKSGGAFQPASNITRADMADYLVMGTEIRQFLPIDGGSLFTDVTTSQAPFAEAVGVPGAALRDWFFAQGAVELPATATRFNPSSQVKRWELAYALVQALGLQAQAQQLNGQAVTTVYNGQRIPVDDSSKIPAGYEGYVQLALDLSILNASFSFTQGPYDLVPAIHANFQPTKLTTRADYAVAATRWLTAWLQ